MRAAAILPPMLFQGKAFEPGIPLQSGKSMYNTIIPCFRAGSFGPGRQTEAGKYIIFYDGYPEQERTRIGDDFPG